MLALFIFIIVDSILETGKDMSHRVLCPVFLFFWEFICTGGPSM